VINLPQYLTVVANNTHLLAAYYMLLTLLEKEIESCEQIIFSLRMKETVIQPYYDFALDVIPHDNEHRLQTLRSIPRSM
jgi:hypothetical protein